MSTRLPPSIDLRPRQRVEREHVETIEHPTLRETAASLVATREQLEGLREYSRRWPAVRAPLDVALAAVEQALAESRAADLHDGILAALDLAERDEDEEPSGAHVLPLRGRP